MSLSNTINADPQWKFSKPSRPLVWLITGCSSGLGLALARTAQAHGHTVVATSRDPSRTPELVREMTAHPTHPGRWLQLDVTHAAAPARVLAELDVDVDVLVNNAGWSVHQAAEGFADDEVRRQFEAVFFGPFRLTRAVLAGMRARRFGVVVNISSGAALEGRESMAAYAAAKAAMDGATKVMAKEVAEFNIRTLTVLLGGFDTQMPVKAITGEAPLPDDYKDTVVSKTIEYMARGSFVGDGDPVKAAKAIYDVVVGEGVGEGREAEMLMPLGRDMEARVKLVRDRLDHCWDVFGDVAMNVYVDR